MYASDATIPQRQPPYIYGEVLSSSVYAPEISELPRFGRLISQGAAAGAVMAFLVGLIGILSQPSNGYNFLMIFALPFLLVGGMALGLFEGVVIWLCTRLARQQLNSAARAGIGVVTLAITAGACSWVLPSSPRSEDLTFADYLLVIAIYLLIGAVFGLVTGSRLQPWREFVRGVKTIPPQARVLTGITGVVLRGLVIWFLMESILTLVCSLQSDTHERDAVFASIAIIHFTAALVTLFARLRLWLLLQLALFINFPIVVLLKEVVPSDELLAQCLIAGYLGLWAAFLITRCSLFYSTLSFLKEEIRYYLID